MSKPIEEMIAALEHRLRATHNVGVSRKDPLLMALTGTWVIVQETLRDGSSAQQQHLAKHMAELELLTARWARSAEVTGDMVAHRIKETSTAALTQALHASCERASLELAGVFARHERVLRIYSWTTALAVFVCALCAFAVWVRG